VKLQVVETNPCGNPSKQRKLHDHYALSYAESHLKNLPVEVEKHINPKATSTDSSNTQDHTESA